MKEARSSLAAGASAALFAAVFFGLTAPLVERAGRGVGAIATACVLYCGASLSACAAALFTRRDGAPLTRAEVPRLVGIALFGAALAPTLLAWGLQRTGATTGALLMNLEVLFTVLLALVVHKEPVGARVAVALFAMALGGATLVVGPRAHTTWGSPIGAIAIACAMFAWGLDNTWTRALATQDAVRVVAAKAALGALATLLGALLVRDPWPAPVACFELLACGATGYGLSLRLYLIAQRRIGAARTASIFALAPFVGAAAAWALGARPHVATTLGAGGLFAFGVYLHLTERHHHAHRHAAVRHEHAHRHDDGHHDHAHEAPVRGEHSHEHVHEALEHDHDHAPDVHHDHDHG